MLTYEVPGLLVDDQSIYQVFLTEEGYNINEINMSDQMIVFQGRKPAITLPTITLLVRKNIRIHYPLNMKNMSNKIMLGTQLFILSPSIIFRIFLLS